MFLALAFAAKTSSANALVPFSSGMLIKASGPAVYYFSESGKRLVFPTERTFKTWYSDFSSVMTISDAELASISLGGNVTYRPGVKLVKITTDPKVYAVSNGGTLRHISSEALAVTLYGTDWNTKVDDVPDAFFTNYFVGAPITSASDFVPSQMTASAPTIDAELAAKASRNQTPGTTVPSTPTTTAPTTTTPTTTTQSVVTFTSTQTAAYPSQSIFMLVNAQDPKGIRDIKMYFDGFNISICNNANICSGEYVMPAMLDKTSYEAKAIVNTMDNRQIQKTIVLPASSNTSTSASAKLTLDRTSVRVGQTTGMTVTADTDISVKRITIYVNNSPAKECSSSERTCNHSQSFEGAIGDTYDIHGIVTDPNGRTFRTETKKLTLAANDSPTISFVADKPYILAGEKMGVRVTASDNDGVQSSEILDAGNNVIKHCDGAAPCYMETGPWSQAGSITLYAKAKDLLGAESIQTLVFPVK